MTEHREGYDKRYGSGVIPLWICQRCGSVVEKTGAHDMFHEALANLAKLMIGAQTP